MYFSSIQSFEILSNTKIFEYIGEGSIPGIFYDAKIQNRIERDIQLICKGHQDDLSNYTIHEMYPQCYLLVWIRKSDDRTTSVFFSEVLFVDEYGDQTTIVCCEKCKRPIDVRAFKTVSHEFIHVLGESFVRLEQVTASKVSHRHTSMSTHLQYNSI